MKSSEARAGSLAFCNPNIDKLRNVRAVPMLVLDPFRNEDILNPLPSVGEITKITIQWIEASTWQWPFPYARSQSQLASQLRPLVENGLQDSLLLMLRD